MEKILACLIGFVFLIVGLKCCHANNATLYPDSCYTEPNIIEYRGKSDTGYYYAVDKNTNTVYVVYVGGGWFGITDAVWPDGKPVTTDELEHNFKR